MTDRYPKVPDWVLNNLKSGLVIPAHPLALDEDRRLDERCQKALSQYYLSAGAGGLAVGVHTTQFEIRNPEHSLLEPVLRLGAEAALHFDENHGDGTVLIAGICGMTDQALSEARLARGLGYHLGMLSLAAWKDRTEEDILCHCRQVAEILPLFGFYLQPAVGGRVFSQSFWRQFVEIPNVYAIKIAPFNRYQTLDVMRAVAESDRWQDVALYTGNDDQIVLDLLGEWVFEVNGEQRSLHFAGGLLGHWAIWTRKAVEMMDAIKLARTRPSISRDWFRLANEVTDSNAALFDAANAFTGCIAGIQHVLFQQGLLSSPHCLLSAEALSPGQLELIDSIRERYPQWVDDAFVAEHIDSWMR